MPRPLPVGAAAQNVTMPPPEPPAGSRGAGAFRPGMGGLLWLASIAVLVGGRMADQLRRVGLLKAVGGTPSLVAAVLLAEHLAVALLATAVGLVVGRLAAPLL